VSAASTDVIEPEICTRPPPISEDDRRRDHFALALFEQQDGQALANVLAGDVLEDARTVGVKREVHRRFVRLAVEAGLGVVQLIAGQNDLALDDQRTAAALQILLGTKRHRTVAGHGRHCLGAVVHQAHFERRRAANDVLGLGGVLHARQLHDHAVDALLLDHGLADAELVDPIVQGGDVLLDGGFLHAAGDIGLENPGQLQVGAVGHFRPRQVGELVGQRVERGSQRLTIAETHLHIVPVSGDAGMSEVLVTQQGANVPRQRFGALREGGLHVDLHQEVHAAAQVETQVHRERPNRGEPVRRPRQQIQRHDVAGVCGIGVEPTAECVLGLQLHVCVGETRFHGSALELHEVGLDACIDQDLRHAALQRRIELERGFGAAYLHGGRLAKEVRQRVEEAPKQCDHDDRVLPPRIAVHDGSFAGQPAAGGRRAPVDRVANTSRVNYLMVPFGRTWTTAERCTWTSTPDAISTCR